MVRAGFTSYVATNVRRMTSPAAEKLKNIREPVQGVKDAHSHFVEWLRGPHNSVMDMGFESMEKNFGLDREHASYVLAGLLAFYLICGSGAQLVCNIIGFAYPAYISVKAVRTEGKDDDTEWLIYWTVFATFSLVDFFAISIMAYFPLYWLLKAMFLIYLYAPETRGALFLFWTVVDPLCTMIDAYIDGHSAPQPPSKME